ncbi:MAG: apolipoprotein N-acyltransferase, partial [Cryptosporangiaceae bacterium]|nr:apolipoprotein N-acyltransferase [Cryptosporangiaceae bacterium]
MSPPNPATAPGATPDQPANPSGAPASPSKNAAADRRPPAQPTRAPNGSAGPATPSAKKPRTPTSPNRAATPATPSPTDTKPAPAEPADAKPGVGESADAKPADAKPADAKPADAKPADAGPVKSKDGKAEPGEIRSVAEQGEGTLAPGTAAEDPGKLAVVVSSTATTVEPATTAEPATAAPGADKPGADKPGADKPEVDKPGADREVSGPRGPWWRRALHLVTHPRELRRRTREDVTGEPGTDLPAWATTRSRLSIRSSPVGRPEAGPRGRALPALAAAPLAAVSGTAMVAAFPPYNLWWLAPLAVAALAVATAGQRIRRGAWLGALHGVAFFVPLLRWTGIYVGPAPWLILALFEALFLALLGAAAAGSSRVVARWPIVAAPVTASLWVTEEALRSRLPWGGFPWGRIAFAQDGSPLLHLASLGGAPLVTFAAALLGGLVAAALWPPHPRRGQLPVVRAVTLVVLAGALGAGALLVPLPLATGASVTVAVVQGNVPRLGLDFNSQRRAVLDNHVKATLALAARVDTGKVARPDLVIWPENASDIDPLQNEDARQLISEAADRIGVPILVGAVLDGPGRYVSNAGIVWKPGTGPGERYVQQHPVPFAEYIPLRSLARKVSAKVDLVRRDFAKGHDPGVLTLGPATAGDVICFEVAYDGLVRDTVLAGANLLVVQTNNATFGKSAESAQQLAMVRLRAIEHGRPAVMASTSGVSATVDASGRVLDESELFTQATFVRELQLGRGRTLAANLAYWPEVVLVL